MHGLITPIEPDRATRRAGAPRTAGATEAVYADPVRRLDAAVATSCGSYHRRNEDAHSSLAGRGRMFIVADGVGGGAMAQLASRLLVAHLHETFAASTPDADGIGAAVLAADRVIADAIARVTDKPGAATMVLGAPLDALAATWLVGLGRRLPRLALVAARAGAARRADARRHLRQSRRAGARGRLGRRSGAHGRQRRDPRRQRRRSTRSPAAKCSRSAATACTSISPTSTGAGCWRSRCRSPSRPSGWSRWRGRRAAPTTRRCC